MPIYEAKCRRCSVKYQYLSKVVDRDKPGKCPGCSSEDTEPVMSATKTTFKHADRRALK